MKYSKFVIVGLIGVLTFGTCGCVKKESEKIDDKKVIESKVETPDTKYKNMSLEKYKSEFGRLYEENIVKLDTYNRYEKIKSDKTTTDYPGNQKYLESLKKDYETSKLEVDKFILSLKKVDTKDKNVKDMNDKLINESEKISKGIEERIKKIGEVSNDLMSKSEVDFRNGISDLLKVDDTTKQDFNKFINETNKFFEIKNK